MAGRLEVALSLVPDHSQVLDVGAGDGLLAEMMQVSGRIRRVVASEYGLGPWQRLQQRLQGVLEVRRGNGLQVIDDAIDTVVVTGVGGGKIARLLLPLKDAPGAVRNLILGPMDHHERCRLGICGIGWHVQEEQLVVERGRLYVLIRAVPGPQPLTMLDLWVGPKLVSQEGPLVAEYLKQLHARLERMRRRHPWARIDALIKEVDRLRQSL